ncbi:MAG: hypothetical protein K0R54_793 [Clostridiaceae bacterium]|jgi:hypothetical protein|nr:hypothetical protein [Clostridiaceae bacterium]
MDRNAEKQIEKIAQEILNIPTLETRNSDRLDFHEISVWRLKEALKKAYYEGVQDSHVIKN